MTPESKDNNADSFTINNIDEISAHEELIKFIKKQFNKIDTQSSIKLARLLLTRQIDIEVKSFKRVYSTFITKNPKKIYDDNSSGKVKHYIEKEFVEELTKKVYTLLKSIGTPLLDIDEDDSKWSLSKIDGVDAFEVTNPTTFQNIREKANREGKHVQFRYDFSQIKKNTENYENKLTTQVIDVHVNDSGEVFDYPLLYYYKCPICSQLSKRFEFEVTSVANKHKCTTLIPAEPKSKTCNTLLSPDTTRTETKTCFIYKISFVDKAGNNCKAEAISFVSLPRGYLQVALQKIPNSYGQIFLHIVDYKPIKKEPMLLPTRKKDEHYLFTMVDSVQEHILEKTGYEHFGFLSMKMSILLEMAARYNMGFLNNFSMGLTGAKSSGKSQFAKYWGITLYSDHSLATMSTSISIPKLRGTMETFNLFGKEHRFQYRGLFAEKDLIVIDELKENPDVKNNLKQYLLEVNFDYSKAGGSSQTHKRNCHVIATQNVDTRHLDKYCKDIKNLYKSDNIKLIEDNDEPKKSWDPTEDLTLPLVVYKNVYLRYSIKKIRAEYERNEINWIDGSEMALKQRFFFYYFLGSDKTSKDLTMTIRANAMRDIISDNTEISKIMDPSLYRKYFESLEKYNKGTNDAEYFDKVDDMLDKYEKRQDARTKSMMYSLLKLIRIVDGRNYCTTKDLEIFQFILESLDNKVEIADTNEFKIHGHYKDNSDDLITEEDDADTFGYSRELE